MGIIQLTDTIRLRKDTRQFMPETLSMKVRKDGSEEEYWKHTGTYHTTVNESLSKLVMNVLADKDHNSLKEYLDDFLLKEKELLKSLTKELL